MSIIVIEKSELIRVDETVYFVGEIDSNDIALRNGTPHNIKIESDDNRYVSIIAVSFRKDIEESYFRLKAKQLFEDILMKKNTLTIGSMLAQQNNLCDLSPYTGNHQSYSPTRTDKGQIDSVQALCFYI